ncbi:MAG TPA: hypothetical protein VD973_16760 [Symbiobacteriaceae bacterium]|jgi:hypothetical protein|nr:hypothetical protein [Symbiobacteriaceae bacterium]
MQMIINLRPDDVERFLDGEEVVALPSQVQDTAATYALIVDLSEIERELEVGFFYGQRYKVRLKR